MANVEKSPSFCAKLKNRNAAKRIKHGSPKLQEVLRQKCRQRMREKRGQLFDNRRYGTMETDEDIQQTLTEIVRQELSQLGTLKAESYLLDENYGEAMTQEEALAREDELLMEEQQWIIQEYLRLQNEEEELMALFAEESLREQIICPLCEKGFVTAVADFLTCLACNMRLPLKTTVEDFGATLQQNITTHSSLCFGQPSFMILPENNTTSLCLTCDACNIFSIIV